MDDAHRSPGASDREPLEQRIQRAAAEGRIGAEDAQIRLNNVAGAQSLTELSLIARDLEQLDAAVRAQTRPVVAPVSEVTNSPAEGASPRTSGRLVPLMILGLVLSTTLAGGIALYAFSAESERGLIGDPGTPGTVRTPAAPISGVPSPQGTPLELTRAGVRSFLDLYERRFGTTKVVDLTIYDDYAVVQVPVAGKARHSGWLYREGEWSEFGTTAANFPGSAVVDLRRLDVAALLRNVARARRTLNVEDYSTTYVSIDFRPGFDPEPNVNIYVSNEFREGGYLATTLAGGVERAYPFEAGRP